ncbi:uncharacterized protein TNCV_476871 [Trichonephila clavipes]|nr:uncharacterized protein TNCV_476871 [Trichonephila clavipes]
MLNEDQSADEIKGASQAELKDMATNGSQKCYDTSNGKKKKTDALPAALCTYDLETIMTLYPKDVWFHVYTDSSAQDDGSAGTGFYCENLFEGSLAEGLGSTNSDTKIKAVRQAICHLTNLCTSYRRAVFLTDSQSAILTLCSLHNSDSKEMEEVRQKSMNSTVLIGLLFFNRSLDIVAS